MRLKVSKLSPKFREKDNWNSKPGHPFAVINGYNSGDITVGSRITRTRICLQIVNQIAFVLSPHFHSVFFFTERFHKIMLCGFPSQLFSLPSHLLSLSSRNLSHEISLFFFSHSTPLRKVCFILHIHICVFSTGKYSLILIVTVR